ncbi:MAG TPA: SLC13 family permease [Vicinamibacterales bacterium]|nr:SLC13 family permease [Vicinamibacterales bacterium]
MSVHAIGLAGLVIIFIIGTFRPINLGVLSMVMTFLIGTFVVRETPREMYSGFPVDLFVLLTGVTYLFGIAARNGTVEWIVDESVGAARRRRSLIPWVVFGLAALPAMAGALGSSGVALLAPLAMRVAERCEIDRRMVGLMVVHGAAAGNFSPLNVLGAIVHQAVTSRGLEMSVWTLFGGNLAYNLVLGAIIVAVFGGRRRRTAQRSSDSDAASVGTKHTRRSLSIDQMCTLAALAAVAIVSLGFGLSIGFVAFAAAAVLHLAFPKSSAGAEKLVAWSVVLLVCGVVMYVNALQRYGTVTAVGAGIASLGTPLVVALLLCAVGAVTSAFASSAGILGAMIPLAAPFMAQGTIGTTGMVTALALSATVVDATPFSTVGALVVANASDDERQVVYRGLLAWGAVMVVTAPVVTWLLFILPAA